MNASVPTYGFYGRLKAEFPSQVIIDTTELCNLACTHCPHPVFSKSEYYAGRSLPIELNHKAIDEVREHGAQYVRYTGEGETLIHKQFFEMLGYATTHAGVPVTVTTNGALLNQPRAEKLLACAPTIVDISIDALLPDTYAIIRKKGDLEVTRANVLKLITLASQQPPEKKTRVVVSFIEQPQNLSETAGFEKFWKEAGADYVAIRKLHSASGAIESVATRMREENKAIERHPCVYPWERIVLNPRGFLSFCPADWTHGSTICDYRTTTISEIWSGPFYKELREAHLKNDFGCHKFCGQCPDWKVTVWPAEGRRSYASLLEDFKSTE